MIYALVVVVRNLNIVVITKGKLVFTVLLSVIACIDIIHICMYGDPFVDQPTGYQFMVVISIIIAGFIGIVTLVGFIVSNWNEPFKKEVMENNKENRLRIYKAALEYGKQTHWAGFCCWIGKVLKPLALEFMPEMYFGGEKYYPEILVYKPLEDPTFWFPSNETGYQTRFRILETIIAEMELELNN